LKILVGESVRCHGTEGVEHFSNAEGIARKVEKLRSEHVKELGLDFGLATLQLPKQRSGTFTHVLFVSLEKRLEVQPYLLVDVVERE